jgi:hypothetical protein
MTEWDGRGLPPVAAGRMRRFTRTGLRASLVTVPGAVGVQSVGFGPVGEVMGCIVEHIGWSGFTTDLAGQDMSHRHTEKISRAG